MVGWSVLGVTVINVRQQHGDEIFVSKSFRSPRDDTCWQQWTCSVFRKSRWKEYYQGTTVLKIALGFVHSDYGYTRDRKNGCRKEDWFDPDNPPFDCPEGTTYNKSSGWVPKASGYVTLAVGCLHQEPQCCRLDFWWLTWSWWPDMPGLTPGYADIIFSSSLVASCCLALNFFVWQLWPGTVFPFLFGYLSTPSRVSTWPWVPWPDLWYQAFGNSCRPSLPLLHIRRTIWTVGLVAECVTPHPWVRPPTCFVDFVCTPLKTAAAPWKWLQRACQNSHQQVRLLTRKCCFGIERPPQTSKGNCIWRLSCLEVRQQANCEMWKLSWLWLTRCPAPLDTNFSQAAAEHWWGHLV